MENLLYLTSNLLHIYAVYIFIQAFIGKSRFSSAIEVATYLVYFLLNSVFHLLLNHLMVKIIMNIVPIFLI